mgnify:CR=1 FL=1|jgi:Zn-dependent protease
MFEIDRNVAVDRRGWSIRIGRIAGIELRIHFVTCLFVVISFYLAWSQQRYSAGDLLAPTGIALLMLAFALAVHELGHAMAAHFTGGRVRSVVLFPFGGCDDIEISRGPQAAFWFYLAGPLANVIFGLLLALVALVNGINLSSFARHPFLPPGMIEGSLLQIALKTGLWLQWMLAVINSLPCGPFDGAMAIRSLAAWKYPRRAQERQNIWLRWGTCSTVCLLTLVVASRWNSDVYEAIAFWLPLTLIALLLIFSVRIDNTSVSELTDTAGQWRTLHRDGDDAWQIDFVDHSDRPTSESLHGRASARATEFDAEAQFASVVDDQSVSCPENETNEEDMERLDVVLAKLHCLGQEQLDQAEVDFLKRVSRRLRHRLDQS